PITPSATAASCLTNRLGSFLVASSNGFMPLRRHICPKENAASCLTNSLESFFSTLATCGTTSSPPISTRMHTALHRITKSLSFKSPTKYSLSFFSYFSSISDKSSRRPVGMTSMSLIFYRQYLVVIDVSYNQLNKLLDLAICYIKPVC